MTRGLHISTNWERLEEGPPEERACFGAIGMSWNDVWLTEGNDTFVNVIRKAPYLSGYHLAEWLTWNWWRLRWEPRSRRPDWPFAHHISTIGGGYVWPNITVFSDGERTAVVARATNERQSTPYRYISDAAAILAARDFEGAIDQFVDAIRGKLRADGIAKTNLDVLWEELTAERRDHSVAQLRKLEALLGHEPDEADEKVIRKLQEDSKELGEAATNEVAAHDGTTGETLTSEKLHSIADQNGFNARPRDSFRLPAKSRLPRQHDVAAWRFGAELAKLVREETGSKNDPISDKRLSDLAGVNEAALGGRGVEQRVAFALDRSPNDGLVVLRSKWKTGRRFELARILGDRLVASNGGKLYPATQAHTYRQKMQRSFAAELLSPFEAIDAVLNGDYSDEAQQEIAERFQVSPLAIRTSLVNHGRIDREEFEREFDFPAA